MTLRTSPTAYPLPPATTVMDPTALVWMLKLAVLHPVVTFVHEIAKLAALNDSGALPELMTWMS